LVQVSLVGDACDLTVLDNDSVDFVIANHVMEHLQDPIRGLHEMARVTKPGGLLYYAIPDPRATFDRRRPVTAVNHMIDEFREGTEATRRDHVQEFVELAEGDPTLVSAPEAIAARVQFLLDTDYSIHYHVFRPDTFLELLSAARAEVGLEVEVVAFAACDGTADDEFIFVLAKGFDARPRSAPSLVPGEHIPRALGIRGVRLLRAGRRGARRALGRVRSGLDRAR
jgi:SAM-dependent methyltransferase